MPPFSDDELDSSLSSEEMRELREASWASRSAIRLFAALLEPAVEPELAVLLVVCPEPVVPQAVTAISRAVAAIGRNMFDAPLMIEEVIGLIRTWVNCYRSTIGYLNFV